MQTKLLTWIPGMTLAVLFTMLIGSVGANDSKLEGTWNVTLTFPCSTGCACPGGTPGIPIPALQMYLKHGSFSEAGGGTGLRSPGLGSWERIGHNQFEARFKFFRFNNDANHSRQSREEVTSDIHLTGHDTFDVTMTSNIFDAGGAPTVLGCTANGTATRFE